MFRDQGALTWFNCPMHIPCLAGDAFLLVAVLATLCGRLSLVISSAFLGLPLWRAQSLNPKPFEAFGFGLSHSHTAAGDPRGLLHAAPGRGRSRAGDPTAP